MAILVVSILFPSILLLLQTFWLPKLHTQYSLDSLVLLQYLRSSLTRYLGGWSLPFTLVAGLLSTEYKLPSKC